MKIGSDGEGEAMRSDACVCGEERRSIQIIHKVSSLPSIQHSEEYVTIGLQT